MTHDPREGVSHDPLCPILERRATCQCELIDNIRADQDAKYVNPNCMWGQAECIPDCPNCNRLDQLYAERVAGYKEGCNDAIKSSIQIIENLPCRCDNGMDYCDGQTDAIEALEKLVVK